MLQRSGVINTALGKGCQLCGRGLLRISQLGMCPENDGEEELEVLKMWAVAIPGLTCGFAQSRTEWAGGKVAFQCLGLKTPTLTPPSPGSPG